MVDIQTRVILYYTVTGATITTLDRFYKVSYSKSYKSPTLFTVSTTLADTNITLRDLVALRVSAVVMQGSTVLLAGVLTPYGVSQNDTGDFDLDLTFSTPEVLFQKRLVLPNPYLPILDQWGVPVVPSRGVVMAFQTPFSMIRGLYAQAMSFPNGSFPATLPALEPGTGTRQWEPVDAHIVQEVVDSLAEEGGIHYQWSPKFNTQESPVIWELLNAHREVSPLPVIGGNSSIPSIINLSIEQDVSSLYAAAFFMGGQVKDELALGMYTQVLDPLTPLQELWDSSNGEEMSPVALQALAMAAVTPKPQATWTGTLVDDIYMRDIRIGDMVTLDLSRTSNFPGYVSAPLMCVAIEGEVGVQATTITLKGDYDV